MKGITSPHPRDNEPMSSESARGGKFVETGLVVMSFEGTAEP
jgi:hypothetical protein